MRYTVQLVIRVRGTRRLLRTFIRPEDAIANNTSSHATRFDSFEDAQRASDQLQQRFEDAGHTYIKTRFFEVD